MTGSETGRPERQGVDLGWHVLHGADLLAALKRCGEGEDPDLVYAELWANADHEKVDGSVEVPRWDQDKTVIANGWQAGRCGKCGEALPS